MPTTITIREAAKPSLVRRVLEAVRSYTVAPIDSRDKALAKLFGAGYQTAAGITVTDDNVFTFSAVYDAVNQSSSDLAKLPLNLRIRAQEGGSRPFENSKTYWLLKHEANPDMSAFEFRRTLQAHALTCKGAFAEIERNGGNQPVALWPLTPDRVEPFLEKIRLPNGFYRSKLRYRIDGDARHVIEAPDMIHIRGLGYDGYCAYPVIDKARQAIGIALAAERYAGAFFGNNSNLGGLLTSDNPDLDESQAKDIQERVEKLHQGPERAWRLLVLGAGFKYNRTGITPTESQLDKTRDGQVVEVARFFNFPVHKLKNLDRSTNNNIEHQDLEYYKGHQLTWMTNWESELNRKLIPSLEVGVQYFKHNATASLRGDATARAALYTVLLDRGVFNADDVLELEDMNPQPNGLGKIYLVQGAMVPKDKVQAIADSQIKKNERPKQTPTGPAPTADPAAANTERSLLEVRLREAEALAAEARQVAQQERDARIAGETSGALSAAEVERLRGVEQASITRAAQLELVLEDLRHDQQLAVEARTRLETELQEMQAARDAATAGAREAAEQLARAAAAQADAEQRAASATGAAETARLAAEAADARAAEARTACETAGADRAASETARHAAEAQAIEARAMADRLSAERATMADEAASLRVAADTARAAAEQRDAAAQGEIAAARVRIAEIEAALETVTTTRAMAETVATATLEMAEARRAALVAELAAAQTALAAERERAETALAATAAAEAERQAAHAAQVEARTARDAAEAAHRAATAELEQVRAAMAAEQQRAAEVQAALVGAREQLATLDTALTSTRGSHETAVTALQATIAALERQAEEIRAHAVAEQARAGALAETVAQREAEIRTVQQADADAMAGVIAAHRGLIVDIMRRMVERETDRARRAQVTPEKMRLWLGSFYEGHADLMRTALLPAVRVHLAFIRSSDDPMETTRRLVEAHVAESVRQLQTVLDEDAEPMATSIPALLYRWDTERPTVLADRLMEKELAYARRI